MKRTLLMIVSAVVLCVTAVAQTPAFPGAEGHGRYVTGGRGGVVKRVTNLNDNGAGSFREAVKGSDKKIVVFDVAGVIALSSSLTIGDNTTILGQTAPSPGVTLRYYTVNPGGNNIIRFMRFRRGQEKDVDDGADASTQRHKTGIIFDHCSFSWSIDEVASFYDNNNFTMQWCTIAESLTNAGHNKGAHGYGGIWGGKLASFHHNMIAHVSNRGPRFNGARYDWRGYTSNYDYATYKWSNPVEAENVDFRNCVMYNAQGTCYGGPGGGQINIVNNFFKAGPCENGNQERITTVSVSTSGNSDTNHPEYYGMTSRYYISGNTTLTTAGKKTENRDWNGVSYDSDVLSMSDGRYSKDPNNMYPASVPSITRNGVKYVPIKMTEEAPIGEVTTHSADAAFTQVLKYVGASLYRDDVDARYVKEATDGTATYKGSVTKKAGLIDVVADVNGYTEATFGTGNHPEGFDTDGDGMPDEWETAWGLDPNNPNDAVKTTMDDNGYYTNIEMYANSLVERIMKDGNAGGTANYTEYWPEIKKVENGGETEGQSVSLLLAQSTNNGQNTSTSYGFTTNGYDVTITNEKSKGYGTGKEDGIKYSAAVKYTINLPKNIKITEAVFKGYDNYADADAYIGELNGTTFEATSYVFPQKIDNDTYVTKELSIPTYAADKLTFTPQGKQIVVAITLNGTFTNGIEFVTTDNKQKSNVMYNLAGQKVDENYRGIVIKNGRKYFNVVK